MNKTAHLIPTKDILVRDPISKDILPPGGEVKPLVGPEGRYWRRRIKDGSVSIYVVSKIKYTRREEK